MDMKIIEFMSSYTNRNNIKKKKKSMKIINI